MSEFRVPKQAIEDAAEITETEAPLAGSADSFQVPSVAVRDLGQTAGDTSLANELLADPQEEEASVSIAEESDLAVALSMEARRANQDFSFTTGLTQESRRKLSKRQEEWLFKVMEKMIETLGDKGVGEKTLGLLVANPANQARLHPRPGPAYIGPDKDMYYLVHLGEPLEDMPFIALGSRGIRRAASRVSKETELLWFRKKRAVVDLRTTPAGDPEVLAMSMGQSAAHWQELLPVLDRRELWRSQGMRWQPWSPAVNIFSGGDEQ